MQTIEPKSYQCRHIFADGHRCGSRALRGEALCYYHHSTRRPAPRQDASPNCSTFTLPFPEDRPAIQSAIGDILLRIATNTIDTRRAGLLLYGLQIASLNLPKSTHQTNEEDIVEDIIDHPTLGPLAAPAEYIHPDNRRPETLARQLLREWEEEEAQEKEQRLTLQAVAEPITNTEPKTMGAPSFPVLSERDPAAGPVGYGSPGKRRMLEVRYPSGVSSEGSAAGAARPSSFPPHTKPKGDPVAMDR